MTLLRTTFITPHSIIRMAQLRWIWLHMTVVEWLEGEANVNVALMKYVLQLHLVMHNVFTSLCVYCTHLTISIA